MKRTRAVFKVSEVHRTGHRNWKQDTVVAHPILAGDQTLVRDAERFHEATPTGTLEFALDNQELIGTFQPGDEFYVDMTPIGPKI